MKKATLTRIVKVALKFIFLINELGRLGPVQQYLEHWYLDLQ